MATKEEKIEKADTILSFIILILILVWFFSGIIGFIASIICFGYEAPLKDKLLGLFFGIFAGPFYWIYYIYNINYCNNYKYY